LAAILSISFTAFVFGVKRYTVLSVGMYMIQLLNDTGTGVYKFSKI